MNIVRRREIQRLNQSRRTPCVEIMDLIFIMYGMYFHFTFAIFLFADAKLGKKGIGRNLTARDFLIILTITKKAKRTEPMIPSVRFAFSKIKTLRLCV